MTVRFSASFHLPDFLKLCIKRLTNLSVEIANTFFYRSRHVLKQKESWLTSVVMTTEDRSRKESCNKKFNTGPLVWQPVYLECAPFDATIVNMINRLANRINGANRI